MKLIIWQNDGNEVAIKLNTGSDNGITGKTRIDICDP
jgi:hypothetical protein